MQGVRQKKCHPAPKIERFIEADIWYTRPVSKCDVSIWKQFERKGRSEKML